MNMNELLVKIKQAPESVEFAEVMAVIDASFEHTPSAFVNGI
jgi:hypothetical protein